ncbi:Rpn family recombination-promoting nuclease/putative transposase [Clostridium perfringens]|uniref:Rpn family recombination-promoting nuclease/putative transposase n=1 Tax=Clostridium perfringens TaxID=1502 RepID=A0ABD4PVS9_CLOPF|nr:Rpn family recombination-promoting nuclease/putative transposase [Clostridium perfringens]MBO3339121.1 Rpn family recombination-promoting nuclease/putative transposase [Clostridium perfringens]MBO3386485.1 Rpn family recombination-promoting nuclease/putative transposase [Clostridium perfringens]MBO3399300.1 Rpn family recombination-promoting nuclease/putative transposase [Clostridium perfringens]MBO3418063.1 Rpn family recombination-promoting nuclease/putative transposase [Clostridium perfri
MVYRTLLNPQIDFVFKKIFGTEKNKPILINFLNAVIKPTTPIKDVEIKNNDIDKDFIEDKFSRLDVKATTSNKEHINIEIQVKNEYNMIQRTLYYWSKMYSEQIQNRDNYSKLERTVCINILNFKYLKNDKYHNAYRLKEITSNEELTDLQEIHFIELPKFNEIGNKEYVENVEKMDALEKWLEFLVEPESNTVRQLELSNEEIKLAKSELYRLSMDSKEREQYNMREKAIYDRISALENAEAKGKKEGKLEGKLESKLEVVKESLSQVLEISLISKITGLSEEEILKIKKDV